MPSSAEPVHPADDSPPGPPGSHGTVIQFDRRTARSGRGRRTPQPEPAADRTAQEDLAVTLEALFLHHQRSLSDEATADVYRITLDAVLLMLEGSQAERLVGEEEFRHLAGMLHGMRDAPEAL